MTETPEYAADPAADTTVMTATPPAVPTRTDERPARSDRFRGSHPLYRVAAAVGALAGAVLIIAVIFWTGFMLGAQGGHHGHHGGGHHHASSMSHHWQGGGGHQGHGGQGGQWQTPGGGGQQGHGGPGGPNPTS